MKKKFISDVDAKISMKQINIIIYGMTYNVGKHLLSSLSNIEQLTDYFNKVLCIIVDNNSNDNTPVELEKWVIMKGTKLNKVLLKNSEKNILMNYIKINNLNSEYEYIIKCNLDDTFWNMDFDSIITCFQYEQNNWNVMECICDNSTIVKKQKLDEVLFYICKMQNFVDEIYNETIVNSELVISHKPKNVITYFEFVNNMVNKIPNIETNPLLYVFNNNLVNKNGLWLEFGVSTGTTINQIAKFSNNKIYGFDTFGGLPTDWIGRIDIPNNKIGSYTNNGKLPKVPTNVKLIKGFFSQTLDIFLQNHKTELITFMHIDCDLYQSTRDIFEKVYNYIDYTGCVIVFDELVNYPYYWLHELKAFYEFLSIHNINYKWIGMNGIFTIESPEKNINNQWLGKDNEIVAVKIYKN